MPTPEDWLLERLKYHGVDVYAGEFATLGDRIGHAIAAGGIRTVVVGRHNGRSETYGQCYERLYGRRLPNVPRDTKLNREAQT